MAPAMSRKSGLLGSVQNNLCVDNCDYANFVTPNRMHDPLHRRRGP